MKFVYVKNIILNTNNAIILYLERRLWRIIDLYVYGSHLGSHLGFWKSHAGGERPPGLNFIETHRTIEKSKETIVTRPSKVMGHATGLTAFVAYLMVLTIRVWTVGLCGAGTFVNSAVPVEMRALKWAVWLITASDRTGDRCYPRPGSATPYTYTVRW